jgi:type III secretory pathway component EscT
LSFPTLDSVFAELGLELEAWLRAWARVMPALVLVPGFGGSALPAPARAGLGISLAVAIAPALAPRGPGSLPFALELAREAALGLPVALSAALLVYVALMAGGVLDDLRGGREGVTLPVFEGTATPLGALLGLLVIVAFHQMGGPARVVAALAVPVPEASSLAFVMGELARSVGLAVAAATPVIVAAIVLSVAEALVARAATPAHIAGLLAPLRGVALLAVVALVLDRIVEFLVLRR